MANTWDTAYLRQAESDYGVFKMLLSTSVAQCHKLHYLQMATEKLAKALVSANNGGRCEDQGHRYIVKLVELLLVNTSSAVRSEFGFDDKAAYVSSLRTDVIPVAEAIQDVYPVKKGGENLEYPWEADGAIIAPVDHCFQDLRLDNAPTTAFTTFIETCFGKANVLLNLFAAAYLTAGP